MQADALDDRLNRELVHHAVARSAQAAADRVAARDGPSSPVARRASEYAKATAAEDNLTLAVITANRLSKLLFGAGLVGLAFAAAKFCYAMLDGLVTSAQAAGSTVTPQQVVGFLGSGSVLAVLLRVAYVAAQSGSEAASDLQTSVSDAFHSTEPARRVVRELEVAERSFFARGGTPPRLVLARMTVSLSGAAGAFLILALVAIPAVVVGVMVAGALDGFAHANTSTTSIPTTTTPSLDY
jgi:hypothetical protein